MSSDKSKPSDRGTPSTVGSAGTRAERTGGVSVVVNSATRVSISYNVERARRQQENISANRGASPAPKTIPD